MTPPKKRISEKKFTPIFVLGGLVLITLLFRTFWIMATENEFHNTKSKILEKIETSMNIREEKLDREFKTILSHESRVTFLVFTNELERNKMGYLNKSLFSELPGVQKEYEGLSHQDMLEKVSESPREFESPYHRIDFEDAYQMISGRKVRVGKIAIGFMRPGKLSFFQSPGKYYQNFYGAWIFFLLSNMMIYPIYLRFRRRHGNSKAYQIEWLEKKLDQEAQKAEDDFDALDSSGSWTDLFNGSDIKDWNLRGEWYVKDECVVGFPWGSSIVTQYDLPYDKYEFEVEAQRMTGSEGFAILFRNGEQQYVWMIGGWKNTRSEVIGFPSTVTKDTLQPSQWYLVKIESNEKNLTGYLDGKKIWELSKDEAPSNPKGLSFQDGFGVGIWSSMARFQRIRIVSTD